MAIEKKTTSTGKTKTIFRTAQHKPIILKCNDKRPERLKGEYRDCTVWSITNATKNSYTKVHEYCKKLGRKDKRRANMGKLMYGLKELGFEHHSESARSRFEKNITVKNYLMYHYNGENVIVNIRGHVFSINNWVIKDNGITTIQFNMNCRILSLHYIDKI